MTCSESSSQGPVLLACHTRNTHHKPVNAHDEGWKHCITGKGLEPHLIIEIGVLSKGIITSPNGLLVCLFLKRRARCCPALLLLWDEHVQPRRKLGICG